MALSVNLTRTESTFEGTFGTILTSSGFSCATGELPFRENEPNVSCIPIGTYAVCWGPSEKFVECYHVIGVPNRTAIEIHAANFCGDINAGFRSDLLGCIALGMKVGIINGQTALMESQKALQEFEAAMANQDFELTIL